MTDPIQKPNPNTSYTRAAAQHFGLDPQKMNGESAAQVKQRQQAEATQQGIQGFLKSGGEHQLGSLAASATGVAAGFAQAYLSVGSTLVSLVQGYGQSMAESDELNEAHRRDSYQGAVTVLASGSLPDGFVEKQLKENDITPSSVANRSTSKTNQFLGQLAGSGQLDHAKQQAESLATAGREHAQRMGITSDAKLQESLRSDAAFAQLYHDASFGFRLGVDSVVYEAQHPANPQPQPASQ